MEHSSSLAQDVYTIQLPDGDNLLPEHEPGSAWFGLMQLPSLFKTQMVCSATQLSCQDCVTLLIGDPASHSPDPADMDKGSSDTLAAAATHWNPTSSGLVTHVHKALQRQVSGHLGGKFAQHLVDYFLVLLKTSPGGKNELTHDSSSLAICNMSIDSGDKSAAERGHDPSNNRWKRYKRSASFDSRKVVLFFSILSSMGTLILIYLTLRVRHIGA